MDYIILLIVVIIIFVIFFLFSLNYKNQHFTVGNKFGCNWWKHTLAAICTGGCRRAPNYKSCTCGCYYTFKCNYPGCSE